MTDPERSSRDGGDRSSGGLGPEEDHEPTRVDLSSGATDKAELARDDAGPWVLLEPPNPVMTFWWRAAAVSLLGLTLVLLLDLPGVAGPRSGGQWTLLSLAALCVVVGGVWLWVAAALPRPMNREIARLAPAPRNGRERRRLSRALLSGKPLAHGDRPAAAAGTAQRYDDLRSPGVQLTLSGFLVTLSAGTTLSIGSWVLPAVLGVLCLQTLLAAHHARALQRGAAHAGVAPLVSHTPQPLGDIGPTAPGRPRTPPRH